MWLAGMLRLPPMRGTISRRCLHTSRRHSQPHRRNANDPLEALRDSSVNLAQVPGRTQAFTKKLIEVMGKAEGPGGEPEH